VGGFWRVFVDGFVDLDKTFTDSCVFFRSDTRRHNLRCFDFIMDYVLDFGFAQYEWIDIPIFNPITTSTGIPAACIEAAKR
jgi:hypothetical protein